MSRRQEHMSGILKIANAKLWGATVCFKMSVTGTTSCGKGKEVASENPSVARITYNENASNTFTPLW
jgi:hypothetical protein